MTMRLIIICDVRAGVVMSSPELVVQALYGSHHGWLNAWLRARLGNAADAADLADSSDPLDPRDPPDPLSKHAEGCSRSEA